MSRVRAVLLLLAAAWPARGAEVAIGVAFRWFNGGFVDVAPGARVSIDSSCWSPTVQVQLFPLGSTKTYAATVLPRENSSGLAAVLPSDIPNGPTELVITGSACPTHTFVRVAPFAMILETEGRTVAGNQLSHPFSRGSVITIRTTGAGAVSQSEMTVQLGDRRFPVDGLRRSVAPGIDEISLVVPADFAGGGCYVPLSVLAAGASSPSVMLSLSEDGKPCAHPFQLTGEQLGKLDNGGSLISGKLNLSSYSSMIFERWDRERVASEALGAPRFVFQALGVPLSVFEVPGCSFGPAIPTAAFRAQSLGPSLPTGLTNLQLDGPNQQRLTLQRISSSYFGMASTSEPTTVGFGPWTVTSEATSVLQPIHWEFAAGPEWKPAIDTSRLSERVIAWTWDGTAFRFGDSLRATLRTGWLTMDCSFPAASGRLEARLPDRVMIPPQPGAAFQAHYWLTTAPLVRPLTLATGEPGLGLVTVSLEADYPSEPGRTQ